MADISDSDSDRAGLENVIRGFVGREYNLHSRVANLEAWSEALMTAIGSWRSQTERLLNELEDVRNLYQRPEWSPEWSDGKDPRGKADPKNRRRRAENGTRNT